MKAFFLGYVSNFHSFFLSFVQNGCFVPLLPVFVNCCLLHLSGEYEFPDGLDVIESCLFCQFHTEGLITYWIQLHYSWQLIHSDEHWQFNKDITLGLILKKLLHLAEYDIHMAKLLDAGRNST